MHWYTYTLLLLCQSIYIGVFSHFASGFLKDSRSSAAYTMSPVHGMQPYRTEYTVHFISKLSPNFQNSLNIYS